MVLKLFFWICEASQSLLTIQCQFPYLAIKKILVPTVLKVGKEFGRGGHFGHADMKQYCGSTGYGCSCSQKAGEGLEVHKDQPRLCKPHSNLQARQLRLLHNLLKLSTFPLSPRPLPLAHVYGSWMAIKGESLGLWKIMDHWEYLPLWRNQLLLDFDPAHVSGMNWSEELETVFEFWGISYIFSVRQR